MSPGGPDLPAPVRALGRLAVHPLLLAVHPALLLWSLNAREVDAGDVWPTIWQPALVTVVVWAIGALALRSWRRGAVVTSVATVAVLNGGRMTLFGDSVMVPATVLVVVLAAVLVRRLTRTTLVPVTAMVNVLALVLVLLTLPPIVSGGRTGQAVATGDEASSGPVGAGGRDIWYLVPDRYPRADTLVEQYGFDNSPFVDHLESLGFQVAEESLANYPKTAHSLAATWNLAPLDDLVPSPPEDGGAWWPLYDLLEDHRLGDLLTDAGYQYLHLGSWWGPTASAATADENIRADTRTEFETVWETQTLLPALLPDGEPGIPTLHDRNLRYSAFQLDELHDLAERRRPDDGPQLVVAHITQPHGPYVFRADGSVLPEAEAESMPEDEAFLGQLRHLNDRFTALVDELTSGPPETWPIIVIQSDEGPNPRGRQEQGPAFDYTTASDRDLRRKLRTFSAILVPGSDLVLPEDLTGVDTWRLLLDEVLGTDFGPVDDVPIEVFRDEDELYELVDVTDRVR